VTWTCDWHEWFSSIIIIVTDLISSFCIVTQSLSKQFFLSFIFGAFSLEGCLLPFFNQANNCFSALFF
jgi:hypothetical protein